MSELEGPYAQGGRQQCLVARAGHHAGHDPGNVYASLVENASLDERRQHGGAHRKQGGTGVGGPHDAPDSAEPSSRLDRLTMSLAAGRQVKTPLGSPSVVGVSGPTMPRTKR